MQQNSMQNMQSMQGMQQNPMTPMSGGINPGQYMIPGNMPMMNQMGGDQQQHYFNNLAAMVRKIIFYFTFSCYVY